MHIFVADDRPLIVLATHAANAPRILRCAGRKRGSGERQEMAAVLRFLTPSITSEGIVALPCAAHTRLLSLANSQAAATARAAFQVFGCQFDGGQKAM
jgi:hypothetical protein